MKFIDKILILVFIVACTNKQLTLEEHANQSVKFAKQKINYPDNDFTILIPQSWNWKIEEYEHDKILLGIDAASLPDKNGFIDIISIQKVRSFSGKKDLESEFIFWLDLLTQKSESDKLLESGGTNLFSRKAYFIKTGSRTGTYGELETISFILDSGVEGVFYLLTGAASRTEDFEMNLAIIIQSLRTFENHVPE